MLYDASHFVNISCWMVKKWWW